MRGDEIFSTWVITLNTPAEWLRAVAWEKGFPPKKDPLTMIPSEVQVAIANVLCPPSLFTERGVAVSYRRTECISGVPSDACLVVFYSLRPVGLAELTSSVVPSFQSVDIVPAYGTLEGIRRLLETDGRSGRIVGRLYHQGLPIGPN